jgi:Domain of unknown function (DUF1707)/TM2 domain
MSTPGPRPIRIGNAEREAAVRALGDHYAQGRLDQEEYEERTTAAYAARTSDDLVPLFDDLPRDEQTTTVLPAPPTVAAPALRSPRDPEAPYGREPMTGIPYSDRYKVVAGVLQLLLPFGIGRFYSGHMGIAIAQLLSSFIVIGVIWAFIDGIVILAGRPTDPRGRPLRP